MFVNQKLKGVNALNIKKKKTNIYYKLYLQFLVYIDIKCLVF